MKQGKDFSYRKSVMKGHRQLKVNCTDEMEDLFSKIFTAEAEKRINFAEIRQHPVFKGHFPPPSQASVILYKTKFKHKPSALKKLQRAPKNEPRTASDLVTSVVCSEDMEQ